MECFKIGDIVARKSYQHDILFKIVDIVERGDEKNYILKGLGYRIQADAPGEDLVIQPDQDVKSHVKSLCLNVDGKAGSKTKK
ncbi:MAG: hypothetical protein N2645_19685 [Clostridia bacterium]|nr:hypothetical protein [Clostridia bacterium]